MLVPSAAKGGFETERNRQNGDPRPTWGFTKLGVLHMLPCQPMHSSAIAETLCTLCERKPPQVASKSTHGPRQCLVNRKAQEEDISCVSTSVTLVTAESHRGQSNHPGLLWRPYARAANQPVLHGSQCTDLPSRF